MNSQMSSFDVERTPLSAYPDKRSHLVSMPLTPSLIADAVRNSADAGITLVLSKKNITEVGAEAAEELASIGTEEQDVLERLALGNNRLTTLPTEFASLSRLRYLNLKHNGFSTFPDVLTSMPSLDTLDVSHNKIKYLPLRPGRLLQLRVFCFARNKITRLPTYLPHFHNLDVLQWERNPIEWPPSNVMRAVVADGKGMKDWIKAVQSWIESENRATKELEDSGYSEQAPVWDSSLEKDHSWRFPSHDRALDVGAPHVRSISVDSNLSMSSIAESLQETEPSFQDVLDQHPVPLLFDNITSGSVDLSPTGSFGSYLPSPGETDSFEITSGADELNRYDLQYSSQQSHFRTSSYAEHRSSGSAKIAPKNSLPDLRNTNWIPTIETPQPPERGLPSLSNRLKSENSDNSTVASHLHDHEPDHMSTTLTENLVSSNHSVPSMAFERNSYFRRLSSMPFSTSLPNPLICLVETARSILFAMSQVYQTIEHYANHAIDDRYSSVFKKVLDPASASMMQLIRSLDRFDAVSQKTLPPPAVCRGLVESCRSTITVSGKAIGVLALQLRLAQCDDARYSRWIVLELYAAKAEISAAWQDLLPHIETLRPFLQGKAIFGHSASIGLPIPEVLSISPSSDPLYAAPRLRSMDNLYPPASTPSVGRTRTARRHAGSFSSKDVEIGKQLPSYDIFPALVGGVALNTPTLRTPKRQTTAPVLASPTPRTFPLTTPTAFPSITHVQEDSNLRHSRRGSSSSLLASSASASSLSLITTSSLLEIPSNSKTQVDREALQAVTDAVQIAPTILDMLEEALGDVLSSNADIRQSLERARDVTIRLSHLARAASSWDRAADKTILREDAHLFLKAVVQISNIIKTYGSSRSISSTLRSNMVKLTNSTEEFAILLHVSSFSPSSPGVLGISPAQNVFYMPEDNRLGSSLSRSRSAQPVPTTKHPPAYDVPHSALPSASFKIPNVRRLRGALEARNDNSEPG